MIRLLILTAFTVFAGSFSVTNAQAQDLNTILDVPKGSTLVNLSATERVEVEQDLLIATLQYKAEHKDAKSVQDDVNKKMKAAIDAAKKVKSVKANTQQYYVHEYDRDRGRTKRADMVWRAQQGLTLKGKKADDLLKLAGDLQEMGLTMSNLSYAVSPELLEETRNSLLEEALVKLRAKAERTAKALGKKNSEFLQINVDIHGGNYAPRMRSAMAMDMEMGMAQAKMSAPVAAPGESEITLSVSANALLSE